MEDIDWAVWFMFVPITWAFAFWIVMQAIR